MRYVYRLPILAALVMAVAAAQPPFKVGIALDAPPQMSGNCHPTRVHFTGRINATARGEVQYQWVRSDDAQTPVHTLRFSKPGPLPITFDWSLSGHFKGWVAFKVLSPNPIESRKVEFRVNCAG